MDSLLLLALGFGVFTAGLFIGNNNGEPLLAYGITFIGAGIAWLAYKKFNKTSSNQAKVNFQNEPGYEKVEASKSPPNKDAVSYKAGKLVRNKIVQAQNNKTNFVSEITKTKFCVYCDERIKQSAKKCKHCGEWQLNPKTP